MTGLQSYPLKVFPYQKVKSFNSLQGGSTLHRAGERFAFMGLSDIPQDIAYRLFILERANHVSKNTAVSDPVSSAPAGFWCL
jgi:hypothetical protein